MGVQEGIEQSYPLGWLLLLLQIIYGLKQATKELFIEVNKALTDMDYEQSKTEPSLYFTWTMVGLILCITSVDD
jgi:hypothetical protein